MYICMYMLCVYMYVCTCMYALCVVSSLLHNDVCCGILHACLLCIHCMYMYMYMLFVVCELYSGVCCVCPCL